MRWSDCKDAVGAAVGLFWQSGSRPGQVTRLPIRPIQEVFGLRRPEMPSRRTLGFFERRRRAGPDGIPANPETVEEPFELDAVEDSFGARHLGPGLPLRKSLAPRQGKRPRHLR